MALKITISTDEENGPTDELAILIKMQLETAGFTLTSIHSEEQSTVDKVQEGKLNPDLLLGHQFHLHVK